MRLGASAAAASLLTLAPDDQQKRHLAGPPHPVHRHDVGRARAPDRSELEHRRYRDEAEAAARVDARFVVALNEHRAMRRRRGRARSASETGRPAKEGFSESTVSAARQRPLHA
jgi:hypothetical protein